MIPEDYILSWQSKAPWAERSQIEGDLILSRVMVELFSDEELANTPITRARFEENLSRKLDNTTFIEDTRSLIVSSLDYDIEEAMRLVHERLVQKISGDPYEGENNIFR